DPGRIVLHVLAVLHRVDVDEDEGGAVVPLAPAGERGEPPLRIDGRPADPVAHLGEPNAGRAVALFRLPHPPLVRDVAPPPVVGGRVTPGLIRDPGPAETRVNPATVP